MTPVDPPNGNSITVTPAVDILNFPMSSGASPKQRHMSAECTAACATMHVVAPA